MVKSKSKQTARAAFSGGLPAHPGVRQKDSLLAYRLGEESPLRLPDAENQPSAATVLRSEYTLGSDAAGHIVFAESPTLDASKQTWVVTAGNTAAAPATTAHPQSTAILAEARVARMVGYKVQVLYIGAEQTAAGYMSFGEVHSATDMNAVTVDSLHTGALAQVRAQDGLEVFVDYTQPPRYEAPGDANFMKVTFPLAAFMVSGLPASTASLLRVRVTRFLEYLPVGGSLAEGETSHEPHNPGALAVHGELSGAATSIKRSNEPGWAQKIVGVANAAYHMAQPMLPYVVPKAREYLATAMKLGLPALLL